MNSYLQPTLLRHKEMKKKKFYGMNRLHTPDVIGTAENNTKQTKTPHFSISIFKLHLKHSFANNRKYSAVYMKRTIT